MISVAAAERHILDRMPQWPSQRLPLGEAAGRVLHEAIAADRDQPPFDRATMDGIAIRARAFVEGCRCFRVQGTQAAGQPRTQLEDGETCLEIMTGAVMPDGADAVIPVERLDLADGVARVDDGAEVSPGRFVHARGSDFPQGQPLLNPGLRLGPTEIAVLASVGRAEVQVNAWPRVAVFSTGDELVEPGEAVAEHQIRCANDYAIGAALAQLGPEQVRRRHLRDDPEALASAVAQALDSSDLLIFSGGVSRGRFDYLPGIFRDLGVEEVFHRVAQKPGKPLWFGIAPKGQPVFGLPGNPVSALVCLRRYVMPAILAGAGAVAKPPAVVTLAEEPAAAGELTQFLPVQLGTGEQGPSATPVRLNTSGDFYALAGTDGLVEWPADPAERPGERRARYFPWRAA